MGDLFSFKDFLKHLETLSEEEQLIVLSRLSDLAKKNEPKNTELAKPDSSGTRVLSCPNCGSVNYKKHGTKDGKQRYRCKEKECGKTFMLTTNTIFARSRLSESQWKIIIRGIVQNLSNNQIADEANLSTKSTWSNKAKIMSLIQSRFGVQDNFKGTVECDEAELHLSYKGKRDPQFFIYKLGRMPRHHRSYAEKLKYLEKYGFMKELEAEPEKLEALLSNKNYLEGTKKDSVCILTGKDHKNNLYIKPICVGKLESTHVTTEFEHRFDDVGVMITDSSPAYRWFAERNNIHLEQIPSGKHSIGKYNLARINALHSNLKMFYAKNRKNLPATKYLDLGLDLFWWLEKNKDLSAKEQIEALFKLMQEEYLILTYQELRHRKLTLDRKGILPPNL